MSYAEREKIKDEDGFHLPMNLGELIRELQEVEQELGPEADVMTVNGNGSIRQMWSVGSEWGQAELFLTEDK